MRALSQSAFWGTLPPKRGTNCGLSAENCAEHRAEDGAEGDGEYYRAMDDADDAETGRVVVPRGNDPDGGGD